MSEHFREHVASLLPFKLLEALPDKPLCIKAVKTFYHVNGIEVKLNERLPRKVAYKDRAPKPEEITAMIDKSAIREAFINSRFSNRWI